MNQSKKNTIIKNSILFCAITLLAGCTSVPVKPKFPEAPAKLLEPCEKLKEITTPEIKLSEFLKIVTENYTLYHTCMVKHDAWVEWYNEQKKNYSTIK